MCTAPAPAAEAPVFRACGLTKDYRMGEVEVRALRGVDLGLYAGDEALTQFRREHVGFVFQFYNPIPSLTARENVALVTGIARQPMAPEDALELVGLRGRMNHLPAQLSGGEQQRVAIARAGIAGEGWVQVGHGLEEGDRVVLHADRELEDGQRVRIRP